MADLNRLSNDLRNAWDARCAIPLRRSEVERMASGGLRVRLAWGEGREATAIMRGPEQAKLFALAVAIGVEAERPKVDGPACAEGQRYTLHCGRPE